jgi:hypothetical protein
MEDEPDYTEDLVLITFFSILAYIITKGLI